MIALLLLIGLAFAKETTYIVTFDDDMEIAELHTHITKTLPRGFQGAKHVYQHALKGYAAVLSPEMYIQVMKHPKLKAIEVDQVVYANKVGQSCNSVNAPSWGLTRVSQRQMDLDGTYKGPVEGAEGITAYIIDTGIRTTHQDFEGRATFGFKASPSWSNGDGNGHGTHVASTVGGRAYGVAKKVNLVAVKVLGDDGSGTNSGVIAGVDWATKDHQSRGGKKSVANMSLGGGYSSALNGAVTAAMRAGLFMVVAAGNENTDACDGSPSSAKDVITVGATDQAVSNGDIRSYFSNYGPCLDIFAPGSDITGAWSTSDTAIRTISGTSMASPHVCGVAALITAANPDANWMEISDLLIGRATTGTIDLDCSSSVCSQSPNAMAFNNC